MPAIRSTDSEQEAKRGVLSMKQLSEPNELKLFKEVIMKQLLSCIIVFFMLVFAVSAMAQDSSMGLGLNSPQTLAPVSIQGKLVSIYSTTGTLYTTLPAYPVETTVASGVSLPSSYKSKSQWLIVHVTLGETCVSDTVSTAVYVDGQSMYPEGSTPSYYFECNNNGGYETRTRTWVLPPEKVGGPAITPGATLELRAMSSSGTAQIGSTRNIIIQAVK